MRYAKSLLNSVTTLLLLIASKPQLPAENLRASPTTNNSSKTLASEKISISNNQPSHQKKRTRYRQSGHPTANEHGLIYVGSFLPAASFRFQSRSMILGK